MAKEYKSFYKTVQGNEGNKCMYSTRLDTYGCGCQHDCSYCYAKSLLDFRKLWDAENPSVADSKKIQRFIKNAIKKGEIVPEKTILRLGGMTDCFQHCEAEYRVTYETIKVLNECRVGYLIVTKSELVAHQEYLDILDKDLAHIQITITTLDDDLYLSKGYEKASVPSARVNALLKLQELGFDVAVRLSPLIPEYMDFDKLNSLGIKKAQVEFLRVNSWIQKWFTDVDYSQHTLKQSNYRHIPLDIKKEIISKIHIPEISVCEDESEAYDYWKNNFNPNPDDCCNLRVVQN